jgi:hypothetical protein
MYSGELPKSNASRLSSSMLLLIVPLPGTSGLDSIPMSQGTESNEKVNKYPHLQIWD